MIKLLKERENEQKKNCTFQPNISFNSNNKKNEQYENSMKKKVDYDRINNLYNEYKDKDQKIARLVKECDMREGITFVPKIKDKNKKMREFKEKIGQMPYLDRVDIYTNNLHCKNINCS